MTTRRPVMASIVACPPIAARGNPGRASRVAMTDRTERELSKSYLYRLVGEETPAERAPSHVLQGWEIQEMAERLLALPPDRLSRRGLDVLRGPLILAAWVLGIAIVVAVAVSVIWLMMQDNTNPF